MYYIKKISLILGMVLLLCLTLPFPQVMAQTVSTEIDISTDKPFSVGERRQIMRRLLENRGLQLRRSSDRVRGLRVISELDDKEDGLRFFRRRRGRRRAEITLVNYNQGKAYRVLVDPNTGAIDREDELPGTPQSSSEEREEAKQIISSDPELGAAIAPGVLIEGGFAVVPPPNSDPRHRYIQMHLVKPDRHSFLRIVTLDLTTGKIAASIQPK